MIAGVYYASFVVLFQIAKNLVYLFDVVAQSNEDLRWLCHRLSVLCNFELVKLPTETVRVGRFSLSFY